MRKFNRALSLALVSAMAFTSLTACNKDNNAGNGDTTTTAAPSSAAPTSAASTDGETETTKTAASDRPTLADYGSGTIKIWVADKVVDFTQARCDEFFKANPDMAGYTVEIQATGEGDAAGNMVTDVQAGADIFGFAQDQLARLVAALIIELIYNSLNACRLAGSAVAKQKHIVGLLAVNKCLRIINEFLLLNLVSDKVIKHNFFHVVDRLKVNTSGCI